VPRNPTSITDTHQLNWLPLPASEGNVPGPVGKLLTSDPDSGAVTWMVHLPPGWHDDVLDWHPSVEESFRLTGSVAHPWVSYGPGAYIYRPPGLLHGPAAADPHMGATGISRFDRELHINRALDRPLGRHGEPVSAEYEDSPSRYVEHPDPDALPWQEAPAGGPWAGASCKWLNRHASGGGVLLLQLAPGWQGRGSAARGTVEECVVEGSFEAGGEHFVTWGYACRAAGAPAGSYRSEEGARLVCWWDADELE
jgi:hypothetical protein